MKKFISILLLLQNILMMLDLEAQTDIFSKITTLDIKIGYHTGTILDQNTSNLVYKSNQPVLGIGWQKNHPQWFYSGNIVLGHGSLISRKFPDRKITFLEEDIYDHLTTTEVPVKGNHTLFSMSFDYLRKMTGGDKINAYIGGHLSEEANYTEGFVTPGLMNIISFAPALEMYYHDLKKSYLRLGIRIPIASLITRSAYHNSVSLPGTKKLAGFWKNGTEFQNMNQHREINIYAAYYHHIGKNLSGGLEYNFRSLTNRSPRILSRVDHEFNLTMRFHK